jgi:hypothetical protein
VNSDRRFVRALLGSLATLFPVPNLIVVPSEDFFHRDNIFDSMGILLQHMLGLPFFDYRTIVKQNAKTTSSAPADGGILCWSEKAASVSRLLHVQVYLI